MKEELFSKLLSYMNNIEGFVSQEIPDIFQQMISYGRISSTFHCILFLLLIFVCCRVVMEANKKSLDLDCDVAFTISLCSSLLGILFIVLLFCSTGRFIKAFFAPKLYLIDYLIGT